MNALPGLLKSKRVIGAIAGVLLMLFIRSVPNLEGLGSLGQSALAVAALALVFWATDVLNVAVTTIFMIGLQMARGIHQNEQAI